MCHESTQDWLYGRGHNKTGGSPVMAPKDGYNSATSRYGTDWSRTIFMLLLSFVGYKAIRPRL